MARVRTFLTAAGLATIAVSYWTRKHPSACPYALRFFVEGPHPGIPRERLLEILAPQSGEELLEVGPGTGYYAIDVASRLDGGTLAIFDIQQKFLDHTVRAGAERGLTNIEPALGTAESLPYADERFDGAYLVTVLGEIPDQRTALRELHRVLKPSGRLVVGETMIGDPHVVTFGRLREQAEPIGFTFERRVGSPLAYFARFRK
jgi:ubiquinone/menaquinone biosynthesis C-methylase UbiE